MAPSRQASITSSIMSTTGGRNHPQNIGPWKLGKTLGRGATGRVLLATHQSTGQKAAVKVVSKSELQDDENDRNGDGLPYGIEREIIIMKLLNHPNVLRLYDVWETSKALYLVLEYVEGGELFDLLVERGPLGEAEAIKYFRQIILGAAYCHALGICHRDLKPENLLLDSQLNVKMADFGMAALECNGKLLETSCGSPHYAAPEIVSGLKYHGAASDVWSCGVILFALLTGRLPFDDENIRNLLLKVQAGSFEMPSDEISREAQNLLARMLEVDPDKRITTERILKHPLLTKYPIPNEDLISEKSLPHPQTAYKSLGSVKNIDKQILANLSILWNDRPQEEIVRNLLVDGSNPEKTFYALLMRYKHNHEDNSSGGPKKSTSFSNKIPRSSSKYSINGTPRRKRTSQISASRPTSFLYKPNAGSSAANNRNSLVRQSAASSVNNSPYKSPYRSPRKSPRKSPHKRYSYSQSPTKSPHRRRSQQQRPLDDEPLKAIPRNIYNEIVDAQSNYSLPPSLPPSLPSKDSRYLNEQPQYQPFQQLTEVPENPIVDETPDLMQSAKISPAKRSSILGKGSTNSSKRMSKRRSVRASMTTGLKRNSITMKLLSTYAKLSGDDDWEYMDKQTKRTSATFAALCDKIFNQEDYNEDDEQLIDPEEVQAKEYERLMEIERKKHEAELKARRELEKKKKRQKRRSILSSRKLSIIIKNDADPNNSEQELVNEEIKQPKRQSKNLAALRALSEGAPQGQELTMEELENLKRRSASQPTPKRRLTPILTRRPVSRLDPLWQAHENEQLEKAKDALEQEWRDSHKRSSTASRKKANRESMISVMDDIVEEDNQADGKRVSRDSYYEKQEEYELPEPTVDDSNLTDDYMTEIRKSRLLNSQLNIKGALADKKQNEPLTLISNVKIPNVTRKSRNFTNSNKRLSVLSMYSTKESYRDLSSIINSKDDKDVSEVNKPALRTSIADRLEKAAYDRADDTETDGDENVSVIDLDEQLANRRLSYYDASDKRASRASTTKRYNLSSNSAGPRPKSKVPDLPRNDYDDTFVSNSDEVHKRRFKSMVSDESSGSDDVFDKIKLPEGKSTKSSIDGLVNGTSANGHRSHNNRKSQPGKEMLIPNFAGDHSQAMTKVRGEASHNDTIPPTPPTHHHDPKRPLDDKTNYPTAEADPKRKGSFFRKLSWGSKKTVETATTNPPQTQSHAPRPAPPPPIKPAVNANRGNMVNTQLPSPTDSREEKPKSSFFRWFSSSSSSPSAADIKKFNSILPKHEMSTALFALLKSWSNFGLKDLRNDQVAYNITGAISKHNSFNLKSCKFRIKINAREYGQKSEIVCARVKGSKATTDTLFAEIEKVLLKEGVLDK
ncbi:Serine/threonine-protein kinase GIN4 [Candida viswanathii]|uniref:non-specific serine/threonine protein kinase n=1 Tax=Candida viswanathii TaxID=5486 RepID=A0A367YDY1_9ASCO|nr:Serine/threonine-protein kinase GIN4 [Candida viswanathii]